MTIVPGDLCVSKWPPLDGRQIAAWIALSAQHVFSSSGMLLLFKRPSVSFDVV